MIYEPFAKPLYVMVKPAGAHCNMRCNYCYYLEKSELYPNEPRHLMSDALLEKYIKEYLEAQSGTEAVFCWHGGETLLRPLSFYKKAVELQRRYGRGLRIANTIQTNGTLLNDDWCRFFHDNGWLVGVSIDGPQHFHDTYRRMTNGTPSFHRVMKGIELLNRHNVAWNAMAVVNSLNANHPEEFYRFFRDINCHFIQFAPIVEPQATTGNDQPQAGDTIPESVSAEQWGRFCCGLFDEWVKNDVGVVSIQLFEATLANWMGINPSVCTLAKTCGHAGVMEYNGDVYSCDHFVFPNHRLGNIHSRTLTEMMYSEQQKAFGNAKRNTLPRQCLECQWLHLCNGECPKNRLTLPAGETNPQKKINHLCEGYRQFFAHTAPFFRRMAAALQNQP